MSNKNTAKETLKNTGLVGGSQVITILIGIIRTKVVAILLGPAGIGVIQLLSTSISLVSSISSLGLGFSGVRDISENIGEGDTNKTAKTITTLKRWVWFSGLLGMLIAILLSKQLSRWSFGEDAYWVEISILSVTIILNNISSSYAAIIRGARRMLDFAKVSVVSSLLTTLIAIPIYYFFRQEGIVSVLILASLISLVLSMLFSRKISFPKVTITLKESFFGGLDMVQLGIFTVFTGFITQATLYYVRTSISDKLGLESVGYYTVATTLAVTYMGLIFTAMSTDYFPKLSAINKDDKAINKAVIEQTKIVLLLGTPLIVGMYTFSEFIIRVLYTSEFTAALPLLMWMLLSVFIRLIGFPIGFVFLAKGKKKIFFFTQSLWNVIFLVLVLISWKYKSDLEGVGIAFTTAYIIGVIVNIIIIKKLTQLKYDTESIRYIFIFSLIMILYFYISYYHSGWYIFTAKIIGVLLLSTYSYKQIEKLVELDLLELIKIQFIKRK